MWHKDQKSAWAFMLAIVRQAQTSCEFWGELCSGNLLPAKDAALHLSLFRQVCKLRKSSLPSVIFAELAGGLIVVLSGGPKFSLGT